MEFRKLWVTFALIGLMVFSLLAFIVQFQTDNQQADSILNNTIINRTYSGLQTNLSSFGSTSQGQRGVFESETPTDSFGSLIIFSIVSSGKIFTGMLVGVFNLLILLPSSLLGLSPVIVSTLSAILIVSIIFALWRVYKVGE